MARDSTHLFTSESVTEGHPDKIADQISDAVLDEILSQDSDARVACETLVTTGLAMIAGEITTDAAVEIPEVARRVIREAGYVDARFGLDAESCAVITSVGRQSPDIRRGVEGGGAGDQGMMFGYATDETESLMPVPITLAHRLTRRLAEVRRAGEVDWLRPDGKSQVTVEYAGGQPLRLRAVVISAQHDDRVEEEEIHGTIRERIIDPVVREAGFETDGLKYHINPTGRFVTGGPMGDAGITGRKIIVDTYGGIGSHGGGAFSGKDPSKVDRSASYAARWAAKNVVAAGLARQVEIQVSYAIGVAEPISVMADSMGTGELPDEEITELVRRVFDFRPRAIIEHLGLERPIYRRTAVYGHFGREPEADGGFAWERTDRVDELRAAAG